MGTMRLWIVLLACASVDCAAVSAFAREPAGAWAASGLREDTGQSAPAEPGAGPGAKLWRAGDVAEAEAVWLRRAEDDSLSRPERARALYNLGVAAFEAQDPLAASAYFESALRLDPRFDDAHKNREIARAEAGLEPAGGEGITASLIESCKSFTQAEGRWLAFGGAVLFALFALGDALRGGRFRGLAWLLLILQPVLWAPLGVRLATSGADDVMVVAETGASVWTGPNRSGKKIGTLTAGTITGRVDELPDWTKVLYHGEERWVPTDSIQAIDR